MKRCVLGGLLLLAALVTVSLSCKRESTAPTPPPLGLPDPRTLPAGLLIDRIPPEADLVLLARRHVLSCPECQDEGGAAHERFIVQPDCNRLVYSTHRQVYWMDVDQAAHPVGQITNLPCAIHGVTPAPDRVHLLVRAGCDDTDGDGAVSESDETHLYLLNLVDGSVIDWSENLPGLVGLNNADWSPDGSKIVFSASRNWAKHRLFTINADGSGLQQLTSDDDPYLDFDPAWSWNDRRIAFNRLPEQPQPWTRPAGVWITNADGSGLTQLTAGGANPEGLPNHGPYPMGVDCDPELSPDNKRVVFCRLVDSQANGPFGDWFLYLIGTDGQGLTRLSQHESVREMVPDWGPAGRIAYTRTMYHQDPMRVTQTLVLWEDGQKKETDLESFPFTVFPLGGEAPKWIPTLAGR